jgi:hypothetical protein
MSKLTEVLKALDGAGKDHLPPTPELIAEKCGLEVEEVEILLAEARRSGLVYSGEDRPVGRSRTASAKD